MFPISQIEQKTIQKIVPFTLTHVLSQTTCQTSFIPNYLGQKNYFMKRIRLKIFLHEIYFRNKHLQIQICLPIKIILTEEQDNFLRSLLTISDLKNISQSIIQTSKYDTRMYHYSFVSYGYAGAWHWMTNTPVT